jgi:membrane fusion protein, multidrug efflux system
MMRKRMVPTLLAASILIGACGKGGHDAAADTAEEEIVPIPVETSLPSRGDVYAVYSGTAPIEAYAEADVVAKVAGEVREIGVEEGDVVKQGQVLARLDGEKLRLELSESGARLQKLKRDYERNVDLKKKGLVSTGDFDKIQYDMEALEATYNLAKLELDYTQIRAPIDGVISQRYAKIGNTIAVGDPAFRVTSLDPLVAYLHVPEREYRNIAEGQPAGIEIDALPGQIVRASVTRVSPIVDPATGTFKITIEISDPERRIKPGMFGRVGIVYDKHENALQVPRSAILEDGGQNSVFVVEDDKANRKQVTTGYSHKGMVEILDGLGETDRIITVGQIGLREGATVTIIKPEDAATDDEASDATQVADDAASD